jgi:GWxTD domain-containing protein
MYISVITCLKYIITIWLCTIHVLSHAQAVNEFNLSHQYNLQYPVFKKKLINTPSGFQLHFELSHKGNNDEILLLFEKRKSFTDVNPVIVPGTDVNINEAVNGVLRGTVRISNTDDYALLTARVEFRNTLYYFDQTLNINYPVNAYLINRKGEPILENFITVNDEVGIIATDTQDSLVTIFYYSHVFSAASTPMTDNPRAESQLNVDSVFQFNYFRTIQKFTKPGLYLVQSDTNSAKGFSFRVENEFYPRYGKLEDLPSPLMYITTKSEFNRLDKARTSKAEFDKIILDITKDPERAKVFIRNYYRNTELANLFFSSFKEGWKTDRGMIFMIYGQPEEVTKTDGREIWTYPAGNQKLRFSFVQGGTIFDPNNFVLIRERKFSDSWFMQVDLWRKVRF